MNIYPKTLDWFLCFHLCQFMWPSFIIIIAVILSQINIIYCHKKRSTLFHCIYIYIFIQYAGNKNNCIIANFYWLKVWQILKLFVNLWLTWSKSVVAIFKLFKAIFKSLQGNLKTKLNKKPKQNQEKNAYPKNQKKLFKGFESFLSLYDFCILLAYDGIPQQ